MHHTTLSRSIVQVGHELAGSSKRVLPPAILSYGERRAETDSQTVLRQEEKRGGRNLPFLVSFVLANETGPSRITLNGVDPGVFGCPFLLALRCVQRALLPLQVHFAVLESRTPCALRPSVCMVA